MTTSLKEIDSQIIFIFDRFDDYIKGAFRRLVDMKKQIMDNKIDALIGEDKTSKKNYRKMWGDLKSNISIDDFSVMACVMKKRYKNWNASPEKQTMVIKSYQPITERDLLSRKLYKVPLKDRPLEENEN